MIAIRLRRTGKKGQPSYRIVVADERAPIYGKYIDILGHYNPDSKKIVLNKEKAVDWMNKGAKPTNTVSKLFQKENLKHDSIVIKKFRAISKQELEAQKAAEEKERAEEAAKKEAAKEAFEAQVEAEKATAPKEDKLMEAAAESIAEVKEEEAAKAEEAPTASAGEEAKKEEKPAEPTPEKVEEPEKQEESK